MRRVWRNIGAFAWKEILTNLRNLRLPLALLLLPSLAVVGAIASAVEYRERVDLVRAGEQEQEVNLKEALAIEDIPSRLRAVLQQGLHAYRLPAPMSVLVNGLEGRLPLDFHAISSRSSCYLRLQTDKPSQQFHGNPLSEWFERPDLLHVVGVVASLLALWFAADSLTTERERQTLRVALANPVSRFTVIAGKQLGGFISIWFPLAIALTAALAVATYIGQLPLTRSLLLRWMWLGLLSTLYLASWFGIGLLLSAVCRSSSTALVSGLFVWLTLTLAWPAAAPLAARALMPVAPRPKIQSWQIDWEAAGGSAKVLKRHSSQFKVPREKTAEEKAKLQLVRMQEASLKRQGDLARLIARLSPPGAFELAATESAGTGPTYYQLVTEADRKYGEEYYEWAFKLRLKDFAKEEISADELSRDALPACVFPTPPLAEAFRRSLLDILLLGGWVVVTGLLGYAVFMRQELT